MPVPVCFRGPVHVVFIVFVAFAIDKHTNFPKGRSVCKRRLGPWEILIQVVGVLRRDNDTVFRHFRSSEKQSSFFQENG